MKDIEMEVQNGAVKYLESGPITKQHFKATNRVTEKRSANNVTGDVILLTPVDANATGSTTYKIGICDIAVAWSMQLRDSKLVIFTSKNIDQIITKYNVSMKTKFLNLANTAKETIEEEIAKIKLEFLQALIENDICIPKNNFDHGETQEQERAPRNDVPASTDAPTTGMVPGRPATV